MSNTFSQWCLDLDSLPQNIGIGPGITKGPWDYVVLGGQVVPGVARVTVDSGSGLDVQKPKGGKKATIVDNGDPPAKVTIELELLPGDVEEFRDFIIPILRPRGKNSGRAPLEIQHPNCEMWGIGIIAVDTIKSPPPKSGGTMTLTINAYEWAPGPEPVKRVEKVKSGDDSEDGGKVFDPTNPDISNLFEPIAPTGDEVLDFLFL